MTFLNSYLRFAFFPFYIIIIIMKGSSSRDIEKGPGSYPVRGVHNLVTKIHNLEALRRYGFAEDEIIELQALKKESEDKVEEFKVSNYNLNFVCRSNTEASRMVR